MSLSRKVRRFLAKKTAGNTASFLFNIDLALQGNLVGGRIRYDSDKGVYHMNFSGNQEKFWCYHPYTLASRVRKHGALGRLTELAEKYSLDTFDVADGDVVVDVGANIGEVGMYYALVKGANVDYHAFEPMKKERQCCALNNPNGKVYEQALWKESSTVTFYQERGGRDDSSLIEPVRYDAKVEVETLTLESFVAYQASTKSRC